MIGHAGSGGDEIEVELALQPLLDDLHVQEPQETAPEPEPQRLAVFGFERERRVVELQFQKRLFEVVVTRTVCGVNARKHHRSCFFVSFKWRFGRTVGIGDGVADGGVRHIFDARGDITDLARREALNRSHAGRIHPDFHHIEALARGEHFDPVPRFHRAVHDAHHGDGAAVVVVVAVEDERFERRVGIALGGREFVHYLREHLVYPRALLCGDLGTARSVQTYDVLYLAAHPFDVRRGQVDLVDDGKYLEIVVEGEIDI